MSEEQTGIVSANNYQDKNDVLNVLSPDFMELYNDPASWAKTIGVLEEKLDPRWIKQREIGNKTLDYIEGARVIELLNHAFNYRWSFEIVNWEIVQAEPWYNKYNKVVEPQGKYVQVLGKLTVPGFGVKMAFGSKTIVGKTSEQESVFKAAMTDSLKKCATMFGIAKELYLDDDSDDDIGTSWDAVAVEVTRLKEIKSKLNIANNDQLVPLIKEWDSTKGDVNDINPGNIKLFNDFLQSKL